MLNSVDGLKVHLISWTVAILCVMEGWLGIDIPGFTPTLEPLDAILAAAGISSVRDMFRKWMG